MADAYRNGREPSERDYAIEELRQSESFAESVVHVLMQVGKSNLLWRLIYGGQTLRTTPCPTHKGVWSGCVWPKDAKDACACMDGSNVTGWLPNAPTGT